jgi:hypothetical protein
VVIDGFGLVSEIFRRTSRELIAAKLLAFRLTTSGRF